MSQPVPRRALIVIDVQNEYIDGNFLIEYPPVSSSLPKIAQAIDAANAHQIPVVLIQHVLPADAPIFAAPVRSCTRWSPSAATIAS
ncbi:hypothetical protein BLKGLAD_66680 [Burkholderia gladioli pv. gladioli]